MDETPDPPVQADADCRSLDAFMLNVERLLAELRERHRAGWRPPEGSPFRAKERADKP